MFMFGVIRMGIPASRGVLPSRAKSLSLELLGGTLWTVALQRAQVSGQSELKCLQMVRLASPSLWLEGRRTNLFFGYQSQH